MAGMLSAGWYSCIDQARASQNANAAERCIIYGCGAPMAFTGRCTVGLACVPGTCGVSGARFVFSADDVWPGIVEGRRLRLYGNPPRAVRALLMRRRNQFV